MIRGGKKAAAVTSIENIVKLIRLFAMDHIAILPQIRRYLFAYESRCRWVESPFLSTLCGAETTTAWRRGRKESSSSVKSFVRDEPEFRRGVWVAHRVRNARKLNSWRKYRRNEPTNNPSHAYPHPKHSSSSSSFTFSTLCHYLAVYLSRYFCLIY